VTTPPDVHRARSRTFKPRRRRLSPTREAALERLLPQLGLEVIGPTLDPVEVFGRQAPLVIEIGCGAGEAALAMASADPSTDLIACDVHTPGIARLLTEIDRLGLTNLRVVHGDALDFAARLRPHSLDEVRIFFPDPWPKPRQRQRRLVRTDLLETIIGLMAVGGHLRIATDVDDYAEQIVEVCGAEPRLEGGPVPRPQERPITRFELKGLEAGRTVTDFSYRVRGDRD
jgi:tRNA (guanine-N7-)-methyltransferase